jgi:hypothetical protein
VGQHAVGDVGELQGVAEPFRAQKLLGRGGEAGLHVTEGGFDRLGRRGGAGERVRRITLRLQMAEQEHQQAVADDALGGDHLAIFVVDIVLHALDRALEGDVFEERAGMVAGGVPGAGEGGGMGRPAKLVGALAAHPTALAARLTWPVSARISMKRRIFSSVQPSSRGRRRTGTQR